MAQSIFVPSEFLARLEASDSRGGMERGTVKIHPERISPAVRR
jgi:hypothetical protein